MKRVLLVAAIVFILLGTAAFLIAVEYQSDELRIDDETWEAITPGMSQKEVENLIGGLGDTVTDTEWEILFHKAEHLKKPYGWVKAWGNLNGIVLVAFDENSQVEDKFFLKDVKSIRKPSWGEKASFLITRLLPG